MEIDNTHTFLLLLGYFFEIATFNFQVPLIDYGYISSLKLVGSFVTYCKNKYYPNHVYYNFAG